MQRQIKIEVFVVVPLPVQDRLMYVCRNKWSRAAERFKTLPVTEFRDAVAYVRLSPVRV